jgi:uncharacterized membrane protein
VAELRFSRYGYVHETVLLGVNVGGALIPSAVACYLLVRVAPPLPALAAALVVALVVHRVARVTPRSGVEVPALLPPVLAAACGLVAGGAHVASTAYVAGTLGTLVGADLWNLRRLGALGTTAASIGGAGTFDGIFLTGIVAAVVTALA